MICFIIAMEEELGNLNEKLGLKELNIYNKKIFYNDKVVFGLSGIGKVNAANTLSLIINKFEEIDKVINIGIAGAYDNLEQGDILIGDKIIYYDFDLTNFGYQKGEVPGHKFFSTNKDLVNDFIKLFTKDNEKFNIGNIASGDKFVLSKKQIDLDLEIMGIDMESGGIAQTALFYNKPFVMIKLISDTLDKKSKLPYNEFEKNSYRMISRIISNYIREVVL